MTTAETEKKPNPVLNILKIIPQILAIMVFLVTVFSNLFIAYILFAPNTMPKPVYLFQPQTGATVSGEGVGNGVEVVPATGGEGEAYKSERGIIIETGTKIVNLAEPGGRKFVRANIALEIISTKEATEETSSKAEGEGSAENPLKAELTALNPIFNDVIISTLTTKDFQSLSSAEGKDKVRQEIIDAINARLKDYKVTNVYFTEFVMQ